jgi:hypothetical protein
MLVLAALGPLAPALRAAEPAPSKRVLLLLPFETSRPAAVAISQGLQQGLKSSYSGTVDILTENVSPVPPVPADFPARISDWLAYKYGSQKFDAIVTVTTGPIHLAEGLRDRFWPGVPLLLVLIQEERQQNPVSVPGAARVVIALDNRETVRSALQLLPATQRLALVGGATAHDRQTNGEIVKAIREVAPSLEIIEITGLSWEESKARVSSLPPPNHRVDRFREL